MLVILKIKKMKKTNFQIFHLKSCLSPFNHHSLLCLISEAFFMLLRFVGESEPPTFPGYVQSLHSIVVLHFFLFLVKTFNTLYCCDNLYKMIW